MLYAIPSWVVPEEQEYAQRLDKKRSEIEEKERKKEGQLEGRGGEGSRQRRNLDWPQSEGQREGKLLQDGEFVGPRSQPD